MNIKKFVLKVIHLQIGHAMKAKARWTVQNSIVEFVAAEKKSVKLNTFLLELFYLVYVVRLWLSKLLVNVNAISEPIVR